jgi:hypothetical protein
MKSGMCEVSGRKGYHLINLSITGDTEQEIERLALAAGLTPGQWLRVAICAAIDFRAVERPRVSDLGKPLSDGLCHDPSCPDAWAVHDLHDLSSQLETAS